MLKRSMIGSLLAMAVAIPLCMGTPAWAGGGPYASPGFEVLSIDVNVTALCDTYAMVKGEILGPNGGDVLIYSRIPEVTWPEIDVVTGPRHPLKCPCHSSTLGYGDDNGYDNYGADSGVLVMKKLSLKESAPPGFGNPGPQTGRLS